MKKAVALFLLIFLVFSLTGCKKETQIVEKELTTEETVRQLTENSWKAMNIYIIGTDSLLSSWDKTHEEDGVMYYRASPPMEYYADWENLITNTYSPEIAEEIFENDDIIDCGGYLYAKGGKKNGFLPGEMSTYTIESETDNEIRVKVTMHFLYSEDKETLTVIRKINGKWLITEEEYSGLGKQ